jgi:hypothetical protein
VIDLERQMKIIAGMLRNSGMDGMKLTLVARHPENQRLYIIKTDDDLRKVANLLPMADAKR